MIGRLHRLGLLLTDRLNPVYRRYGLSEGEFDVLAALRRAGEPFERAPGELAVHPMVTTGAMTERIDRLERDGLPVRDAVRLEALLTDWLARVEPPPPS